MLLVRVYSENTTLSHDISALTKRHKLTNFWPFLSTFGLIGTFLNGFVMTVLITERHSLTTSVNVMIW